MIPLFPKFKKLEFSDKAEIKKSTQKFPPYADFNFTNLWTWNIYEKMELSFSNENLVVKYTDYLTGVPFLSFLGENYVNETARELLDFALQNGLKAELKLIPEVTASNVRPEILVSEDRDNFDYIYSTKEQSEYEGSKFLKKRNQITKFLKCHKNISVEIRKLGEDGNNIRKDILQLHEKWKKNKQKKEKEFQHKHENLALQRYLSQTFDHLIVCVYVEGELVAYTATEILEGGTYAINHFSKVNTDINGVNTFVMSESCRNLFLRGVKYLNYEQDLGLENLRKAKALFRPCDFLKKYVIHL